MILLSAVFLPFSLDLVKADFSDIVALWWPVILVLMGLALIVAYIGRRSGR
jgi:hypothetical protein